MAQQHCVTRVCILLLTLGLLVPSSGLAQTDEGPNELKLPGLVIHVQENHVDVEATVCLAEGYLEVIACTKGSREHESLVVVAAKPQHIHAALLLIGAEPGHPAMRKPTDETNERWVDLPPRGERIEVRLVTVDAKGKQTEHLLSEFVTDEGQDVEQPLAHPADQPEDRAVFPSTFLFAGSHIAQSEAGERIYLADQSGNVMSVSTFGDEVLCLPGEHSHDNASLIWRVNPQTVPAVGTKVTLRLRRSEAQEPIAPEAKTPSVAGER